MVGSRELGEENRIFAENVGRQAALQGYVLVSGNAKGADSTAQESCLTGGGSVICVVADELEKHPVQKNVLYLSEDGFDMVFSPYRALQRNRIIHSLGSCTFVAQSGLKAAAHGMVRRRTCSMAGAMYTVSGTVAMPARNLSSWALC